MQSVSSFHRPVHSQLITMKTLKEGTHIRSVCVDDIRQTTFKFSEGAVSLDILLLFELMPLPPIQINFQLFQPLRTMWGISASSSPSSANVDPWYFNVFNVFTVPSCKWICTRKSLAASNRSCNTPVCPVCTPACSGQPTTTLSHILSLNNHCVRSRMGHAIHNTKFTHERECHKWLHHNHWKPSRRPTCVCNNAVHRMLGQSTHVPIRLLALRVRLYVALLLHNLLIITIIWYLNCMFIIFLYFLIISIQW